MIVDIKDALVNATTEKVRAAVASDDIKAAALDQAFKAIADPNAPAGEDAVANLYSSAFKEFNDRVQKLSAEPQALSPELQAELLEEMKSVARREGLEDLPLEAPTHISVTNM